MTAHSPLRVEPAGLELSHPYVIVTPPFAEQSAGIRVLHWLCDALNRAGAEAYVATDMSLGAAGADPQRGLKLGLATPSFGNAEENALRRQGRRPIVIYPETPTSVRVDGVSVCYLLNYPGVMDSAPSLARYDLVVAYTEKVRRQAAGCRDILFIPGSDARYWTPAAAPFRDRWFVYAGKYVEHHRQRLPLHLRDVVRIHRQGALSPTRDEIRELLRNAKGLYVFENTALAAEAALCGCPVMACYNWFFTELLAEHELGLRGFASEDSAAGWARAREGLDDFRRQWQAVADHFPVALLSFIQRTQAVAAAKS